MPKRKYKIVAIGAGNVATHFSKALSKKNNLAQVWSRDINNARIIAKQYGATAIDDFEKLDLDADLYLIMVPDHAIKEVVKVLRKKITGEHQIIAHTSGATSNDVFKGIKCNWGVFYALQSIPKYADIKLNKLPFLISGNRAETTEQLMKLAKAISKNVRIINDETRLKYHIAAVFVNNFVNHIFCKTNQWMEAENLELEVLTPIINQTFEKLLTQDACKIQTGPAKRSDKKTMKKHMDLLKEHKDLKDIYREISQSIQNQYK